MNCQHLKNSEKWKCYPYVNPKHVWFIDIFANIYSLPHILPLLPRQPAIKYMWINMINVEFSSFSINKMLAFLCRAFVEFESQEQK